MCITTNETVTMETVNMKNIFKDVKTRVFSRQPFELTIHVNN